MLEPTPPIQQPPMSPSEPIPHKRPSWDEYFMQICKVIASRGTCDRGRTGCVITKDKRIISTGYVGAPAGLPHCDEVGHLYKKVYNPDGSFSQHCVRTVHAEQNAICQAARMGVSLEGATLYCKMEPCHVCAQLIINCGIKRVVCEKRYHQAQLSRDFFAQAGVSLIVLNDEIEIYDKM
jgi:dCMP deaminase